jgi:hypothetical protein
LADEDSVDLVSYVVPLCHSVIERIFEKQGLQVAQFAVDGEQDDELYANVADLIPIVIDEQDIPSDLISPIRRVALQVLRKTFYDATPTERVYLEKLSRTYVLMLLLKNDAKIVEYFKSVSSGFRLYVGTDFIIRALSEHYLDPANQSTVNLFKVLVEAGATLILTEKTVEEVATHIRAQIFEFENTYSHLEHKIEFGYVEYIDRILIRSYFYARLAPLSSRKAPSGWRSYIEQFASYSAIRNDRGDEELARYLVAKFGFQYETTQEMESGVDLDDVNRLKEDILKARAEFGPLKESSELLAYNDALQVLRVYSARRQGAESSPSNPFGFKTWWLTQDGKVRRASARVVRENGNHRFMMRPEFLLNFIAFAPSGREVEASYRTVFPSILGVRLSNRVRSDLFRKVMRDANEAWQVDEARSSAMVTELLDALKGDNLKVYENRMWENSD